MDARPDIGSGIADLHLHTITSDGTVGIEDRIEHAQELGIETIAITDHDAISDSLQKPTERRDWVEIITGVEVRADLLDTKIEILGYFVNPNSHPLQSMLDQVRTFRQRRNAELVSELSDSTGLNLSHDELTESVEGNLGRPHLAEILVENGIVDSVQEAFDQYLGEGGEAFVPMQRLPAEEVIETIHNAGGVTSLAHPGRIRASAETVERMVAQLTDEGIDGIEVRYPYSVDKSDSYADINVPEADGLARRFELVPTGGSDCHGPGSGKFRFGDVRIRAQSLKRLKDIYEERHQSD